MVRLMVRGLGMRRTFFQYFISDRFVEHLGVEASLGDAAFLISSQTEAGVQDGGEGGELAPRWRRSARGRACPGQVIIVIRFLTIGIHEYFKC